MNCNTIHLQNQYLVENFIRYYRREGGCRKVKNI